MKIGKSLTVVAAAVASLHAQAQPPGYKSSVPADLRSLLRQGSHVPQPAPRQLSNEEREVLRRQLSQPVRRESKRS